MRRTHPGEMGGTMCPPPEPGCRGAAAAPCSASLLSSAGFAPCTACCTPTRRGAPPTWFTRRHVSPPTSSRISPVSDGRAGPACGCVGSASPRGGRTDVVAVVLHSVCVLKAAVRPLSPHPACPACPAAPARCPLRPGRRGGTGPEHLTAGHPAALASPTPCVGSHRRRCAALPPPGFISPFFFFSF